MYNVFFIIIIFFGLRKVYSRMIYGVSKWRCVRVKRRATRLDFKLEGDALRSVTYHTGVEKATRIKFTVEILLPRRLKLENVSVLKIKRKLRQILVHNVEII